MAVWQSKNYQIEYCPTEDERQLFQRTAVKNKYSSISEGIIFMVGEQLFSVYEIIELPKGHFSISHSNKNLLTIPIHIIFNLNRFIQDQKITGIDQGLFVYGWYMNYLELKGPTYINNPLLEWK